MAFKEEQPIADSLGLKAADVKKYTDPKVKEKKEEKVKEVKELTPAKYLQLAECFLVDGVEKHNGIRMVAQLVDLDVEQVEAIIPELDLMRAKSEAAE